MAASLAFAALDQGPVPLERLREAHAQALQRAHGGDDEPVALVLPHRLTTLLTHVFPQGLATLGNVAECVELTEDLAKIHCHRVVYLSLPVVDDVRSIATHMGLLRAFDPSTERTFHLLVAGKWTAMCAEALECQSHDTVHIQEVAMGFIPLDQDLLTLGRERCLLDCHVNGDRSVLVDCAQAIQQLQRLYGRFENIKYKGDLAAFVCHQLMEREQQEEDEEEKMEEMTGVASPERRRKSPRYRKRRPMHSLVLLDRRLDYATALSTPLTMEALLAELFEFLDGVVTLGSTSMSPGEQGETVEETVFPLNTSDTVFRQIRGLHLHAVAPVLNAHASGMKDAFDRFRTTSATATTAEIHEFVKSVPQMQSQQKTLERLVTMLETLETNTATSAFRDTWRLERAMMDRDADSSEILDSIEELIFQHEPLLKVLRLLCLFSVTHNGVPRHELLRLKMHLVRAYGHELIFSFSTLARVGLLVEKDSNSHDEHVFEDVAEALGLLDVDVNVQNPRGAAFVTGGYAPITTRLIEELLKDGSTWESLPGQILHKLPGRRAEITRVQAQRKKEKHDKRVMVVCFVGGVTYAEVAALRWLAQFYPYDIIIASTSVITGQSFLQDVLERLPSTT
ncbi:hypothetical protein Poli38472_010258 [Pythium oligandrum]|uniref:Uncharacterized protein n=1 Tax=Pythium oligandrum TaxID=41045 RepID=A0A8K1C916_PYTOL|nr:hypothetical protein Poli38472_010258 [Pythium oligandrum]|eukprot:TMW58699.1 hypothetical protein Poli38472_010258 [Pythium oligandrum]